ncbi:hypothetical protein Tco_0264534 [Tanacetum coccineum]
MLQSPPVRRALSSRLKSRTLDKGIKVTTPQHGLGLSECIALIPSVTPPKSGRSGMVTLGCYFRAQRICVDEEV